MISNVVLAAFILTAGNGLAGQTRILIPSYDVDPIAGSNGSIWASTLWIRNEGASTATYVALPCQYPECPDGPRELPIEPGGNARNPFFYRTGPSPRTKGFLIVSPADAKVRVSLHVRDLSRQAQTWGTEIPTVGENEFLTGIASLLPIPADSRFRVMLRLYTRDEGSVPHFVVRAYTMVDVYGAGIEGELLGEFSVTGWPATVYDPGYAEVPAVIDRIPDAAGRERIRLEIEPLDPTAAWWAFATVTNNTTQHVTVVSP